MTEWVTYGSVGVAAGNSRSYPEAVNGPVIGTWASPRTQCRLHCTLALEFGLQIRFGRHADFSVTSGSMKRNVFYGFRLSVQE